MNTSRQILANLGYKVYRARHRIAKTRKYIGTEKKYIYHEAVSEWGVLHNAFQQAKQIYLDNLPED
jgi:hypothetical protein